MTMQAKQQMNAPMYEVSAARGCTRYKLTIQEGPGFPHAIVLARVIPEATLGTWRVVVSAGSRTHLSIVTDLCLNNIADEGSACSWARECVRAAEQFWKDCMGV